jgi:biotin carboxyl carrier protein
MEVRCPLPGIVLGVKVAMGEQISKGDTLILLEVMKAQHQIKSPSNGKVNKICVDVGEKLKPGQVIMEIDE